MSLPEISRRCLACGAAVRAGARFCPQCGKPMSHEGASASSAMRETLEPQPRVTPESWRSEAERVGEELAQQKTRSVSEDSPVIAPPRLGDVASAPVTPASEDEFDDADEAGVDQREGEQRRRRAAAVKDNLKLRGERMREASIVVLEEASEDSGLRFIIIVILLFLLFLLFLFLSTTLK